MDFHSLKRKDLQALCKKNKIPANMTNVAMADALKSLENVEGIEEIMEQSQFNVQESPEKTISGSPEIPRTATRTSTRRKPVKEEQQSSQTMARSRRVTRRTTADESDQESKNVKMSITPAVPASWRKAPVTSVRRKMATEDEEDEKVLEKEKSDVPITPSVQSCQRRGPVVEGSLHQTRRSVRLSEKNIADFSLINAGPIEPVRIDELSKEIEEIKENKDVSVLDAKEIEAHDESTDEPDGQKENLEKATYRNDELIEEKCSDDVPVGENLSVAMEMNEVLVSHLLLDEENSDDVSSEASDPAVAADRSLIQETENLEHGEDSLMPNLSALSHSDEDVNPDSESVNLVGKEDSDMNEVDEGRQSVLDNIQSTEDQMECSEHKEAFDFAENQNDNSEQFECKEAPAIPELALAIQNVQDEVNKVDAEPDAAEKNIDLNLASEKPIHEEQMNCSEPKLDSDMINQKLLCVVESGEDINSSDDVMVEPQPVEGLVLEMEEYNAEALIDASVYEAEEFFPMPQNCQASAKSIVKIPQSFEGKAEEQMQEYGNPEYLVDVCVMPAEEFSMASPLCPPKLDNTPTPLKQSSPYPQPLVSGTSPLAACLVPSHFPRPTLLTSTMQSSCKKQQTTIQEVTQVLDNNKENIDKSGRKVEPKRVKTKKTEKVNVAPLDSLSIRQLTKMIKELQITKTNTEDKSSIKQAENTRPALQALPENRIRAREVEDK